MSETKNTKPHCIAPWTSLYVQHDGNVFPCCLWTRFTPIGNLHNQSLDEVWNSDQMKLLRNDMLENNFVPNCEDCRFVETSGQKSLRHEYLEEQKDHIDRVSKTKSDGTYEELSPVFLSFAVGTECQLRCRMCGPYDSNSWRAEVGSPKNYRSISEEMSAKKALELVSLNKTLTRVLFVGGEPLIIPLHYEILNALLDSKKEKDVELYYNSNLVQLQWKSHNIINYWNQFSKVTLLVSIDGTLDHFNFIRTGHNWNTLLSNLETVRRECPSTEPFAYITLSLYNFFYIPEIVETLLKNNLFTIDKILFNRVSDPEHMNAQNAPASLKQWARKKYTLYMKKLLAEYDYQDALRIIASLNLLLSYIESKEDDSNMYTEFIRFNKNSKSRINHWDLFQSFFPDLLTS
jgi:radical SAM protein with 4Fe4S-binding SPASM domain